MLLQETARGYPACFCWDISLWFGIDNAIVTINSRIVGYYRK